jgi:predicted transcriptional regulator
VRTLLEIKRTTPITTQEIAKQAGLSVADVFVVEAGGFTSQTIATRVLAAFNRLSGMHLTLNDIITQSIQNHHQDSHFKRVALQRM